MKVAFVQDNVKAAEGIKESAKFSIAATAQAFEILSSGLYSDKVRAVLREIGCNAMDAHIAAGEPDKPFRVKIPNDLDDQFYIQDWGPGLSHEEVMKLYSTYFASTKQSSNAFTGAFGLGSKSPFSYTKQFHVTSTHGGKKRTYALYIDNDGQPTCSLMAEEDPDKGWAHGMRVGFAVKPEDAEEFGTKAIEVFKWFRVVPTMKGVNAIEPVKYSYMCDDFGFLDRDDPECEAGVVHAVMGNVMYPVNLDQLGVEEINDKAKAAVLLNYASVFRGLVLFVPIGGVRVTASREHLDYKPNTIKALKELLILAVKRASKEAVEALEAASSGDWKDLCNAKERVTQTLGQHGDVRWHFMSMCKALGLDDKVSKKLEQFVEHDYVEVPYEKAKDLTSYIVRRRRDGSKRATVATRDGFTGKRFEIEAESAVMVGSVVKVMSRAKRAIVDDKFRQILVVARPAKDRRPHSEVVAAAEKMAEALGGVPIVDAAAYETMVGDLVAKKKSRGKNWVPTLPVGLTFKSIVDEGKKAESLELGDPKLDQTLFACRRPIRGSYRMRVFNTTADEDLELDWHGWQSLWQDMNIVQAAVKLPNYPRAYAIVDAANLKSIGLQKLGWTNAYDAVKAYAAMPEVRDELRKHIKRKHLEAPEDIRHIDSADWVGGLALLRHELKSAELDAMLDKAELLDLAKSMVATRKKNKGADTEVPKEVQAYQDMCSTLHLADTLASDIKAALTVEDANAAFCSRYPLTELLNANDVLNNHRPLALDAIRFILSREK